VDPTWHARTWVTRQCTWGTNVPPRSAVEE
jgi:hypothetical protein